ncbi:hypothetical protein WL36_02215 [Burkholderia ubonensis]|nr:hypothetical protein WL36_02215 [Burkholderia ubonensis]
MANQRLYIGADRKHCIIPRLIGRIAIHVDTLQIGAICIVGVAIPFDFDSNLDFEFHGGNSYRDLHWRLQSIPDLAHAVINGFPLRYVYHNSAQCLITKHI